MTFQPGDQVTIHYTHTGRKAESRRATIIERGYMPDSWRVAYHKNGREEIVHENFIIKESD